MADTYDGRTFVCAFLAAVLCVIGIASAANSTPNICREIEQELKESVRMGMIDQETADHIFHNCKLTQEGLK